MRDYGASFAVAWAGGDMHFRVSNLWSRIYFVERMLWWAVDPWIEMCMASNS